jgi:hypothetical protein
MSKKFPNLVFVEPWAGIGHARILISKEDAIKYQRKKAEQKGFEYKDDQQALEDFMVVHYATETDEKL